MTAHTTLALTRWVCEHGHETWTRGTPLAHCGHAPAGVPCPGVPVPSTTTTTKRGSKP